MKKVVIVVSALVILLAIVFGSKSIYNHSQMLKIDNEIDYFNENGYINDEIVTKGEYAKIEKLVEDDLILYNESVNAIKEVHQDEEFLNIVTPKNFSSDGPKFNKSMELLSLMRYNINDKLATLDTIISPEEINKRMVGENLRKSYYKKYEGYITKLEYKKTIDEIYYSYKRSVFKIDKATIILEYLSANKNKWAIKKNELISKDKEFLEKYDILIYEYNNAAY